MPAPQPDSENPQLHEATLAWRNAVAAALLTIAGQLAFLAFDANLFGRGIVLWARLGHIAFSVLVLAWLLARHRHPTERQAVAAFTLLTLTMLPLFWVAEAHMVDLGRPWAPFVGHRLVMLGLAALMPGPAVWVGLLIVVFATTALVQYYAFGIVDQVDIVNAAEPWLTAVYAAFAIAILAIRTQHRELARRFAKSVAEADALRQLARFLLAVRDLSNTPIQTLEIDTAILERRHPEDKAAIRRMRAAVGQLREISRILAQSDHLAAWDRSRESFDPVEALRWLEQGRTPSGQTADGAGPRPTLQT